MNKHPRKNHNVVQIPAKPRGNRGAAPDDFAGNAAAPGARAAVGSPDDPRMQEAMRLMQAFLAVEDASARSAIVTLAESLVSYDWVRKARQR